MLHRPALLLALTTLCAVSSAQIAQPGRPASARTRFATEVPAVVLPRPDLDRLRAEDAATGNWPYRYGAVIPVAYSCQDAGVWEELPSGELVWRLRLASPGAESLSVLFDRYEIPAGGELFLYDAAGRDVLGAFTAETRQPNGMLAVQPIAGDDVVIEYVQPAGLTAQPVLRVGEVVHDYRGVLRQLDAQNPIALGGGCLVDVNCPAGDAYQDIKRSVMMVLAGGTLCSAGLLNNTAQDGTPYLLTANHCGSMVNVVAVFMYENSGCGPGGASQSQTVSGSTFLAANGNFDSQLYQLSSPPPQSYSPFYAGWDRNTVQPAPAISISHPSGNPKKIARDNGAPQNSGRQWLVTWELGILQGGSSGSPLFNGAKRVIGPACCVSDFNCHTQFAFYGRFGGFWTAEHLEQWLDPLGSDPTAMEGMDPFQALAIPYFGSGQNLSVYTSTTPPKIASNWIAAIDTSLLPINNTWIIGRTAPSSGIFLAAGELLVSPASPRLFRSVAPSIAGNSVHTNAIPPDPGLTGLVIYTQGLMLSPGIQVLTNGIELHLR